VTAAALARWEAESNASSAPGMHEELIACIAEVRRLRGLLAEVQWAADDDGAGVCPLCRGGYPDPQHAPDCRLAAAL